MDEMEMGLMFSMMMYYGDETHDKMGEKKQVVNKIALQKPLLEGVFLVI